ncbi:MAG TPA: Ig-like domain-containing protein, partial [Acidobacteriota bacterium]|nr:Ig-like domain-containing protein [Acidobacteriota bacterium]
MKSQRFAVVVFALLVAAAPVASQQGDLQVRIVSPENDTYVSGTTTIRLEVNQVADTAIARVTIRVDGSVLAVLEEPPWEVEWNAGEEFNQHVVDAEVVDVTGREDADTVLTRDLETAVFRAEVNAVLLYVSALDGGGRYVPGLAADDFEVYENGKRQDIASFSAEPRPMVVGLLLDTSGSMQEGAKLERARQGALAFLDQIGGGDEAFVMTFDSFPML